MEGKAEVRPVHRLTAGATPPAAEIDTDSSGAVQGPNYPAQWTLSSAAECSVRSGVRSAAVW